MAYVTKEQNQRLLERIKSEISIVDYGLRLGFTPKKVGRYITFKEHDSVRVDEQANRYVRYSGVPTGFTPTIIDFVMEFDRSCSNLHDALGKLTELVGGAVVDILPAPPKAKPAEKPKPELILPERDDTVKNVFAYLVKTRCIDKELVSGLIAEKRLYQDKHKNCVFVNYAEDGKAVYAQKKGTNTQKPFQQELPGNDYKYGFEQNFGSSSLVVTESIVDSLSYQTLLKQMGIKPGGYNYLALGGVHKLSTVSSYLERNEDINKVVIGFDNDEKGQQAAIQLIRQLTDQKRELEVTVVKPKHKDFNEDLQKKGIKKELVYTL